MDVSFLLRVAVECAAQKDSRRQKAVETETSGSVVKDSPRRKPPSDGTLPRHR
jgi:hypothetical protein